MKESTAPGGFFIISSCVVSKLLLKLLFFISTLLSFSDFRGIVIGETLHDASGLRTERTSGYTTYTYIYDGSTLSQMTMNGIPMHFTYGVNGQPISINYNGTEYYYITNAQGDVVGILNGSGVEVVSYVYDAWGNHISISGSMAGALGIYNPLRYRGYVYDQETGLYYLQSRYYNPTICRFINADAFTSTGQGIIGNNMFAYCGNNPVMYVDFSGESFSIILGINGNLFGLGGIYTVNFVSTNENFGIQYSYYLSDDAEISKKNNQTIGIDIGPYLGIQYTDKENMKDLEGFAKSTGGDILGGFDVLTDESDNYLGWQFGVSAFSANMHSLYTNTETLLCIPTINIIEIVVNWILGG